MTALTLQLEDSLVQRLTRKARGIQLQTYIEQLLLLSLAADQANEKESVPSARSLSSLYGICPLPQGETIESLRSEAMTDKFSV